MPGFDGKGPEGKGPLTGGGRGDCRKNSGAGGRGRGRCGGQGLGRGQGGGRARGIRQGQGAGQGRVMGRSQRDVDAGLRQEAERKQEVTPKEQTADDRGNRNEE